MFPDNESTKEVTWNSAINGKRYELVMRFNYGEVWVDQPDTLWQYIDWKFPGKKSQDIDGGEEMEILFGNNQFYEWCQTLIPYDDERETTLDSRVPDKIELFFSVAGDEFNTYMEVNAPTSSIIQERPEYTNIENGIGIFSCRYNKQRTYWLHPLAQEILETKGLKFVKLIGK
jgi:hypothetical protein